jgi:hypothetical protein
MDVQDSLDDSLLDGNVFFADCCSMATFCHIRAVYSFENGFKIYIGKPPTRRTAVYNWNRQHRYFRGELDLLDFQASLSIKNLLNAQPQYHSCALEFNPVINKFVVHDSACICNRKLG